MPPDAPEKLVRRTFALLRDARMGERKDRINLFRWILQDPCVGSTNDLDELELQVIVNVLSTWQQQGELEFKARESVDIWVRGQV